MHRSTSVPLLHGVATALPQASNPSKSPTPPLHIQLPSPTLMPMPLPPSGTGSPTATSVVKHGTHVRSLSGQFHNSSSDLPPMPHAYSKGSKAGGGLFINSKLYRHFNAFMQKYYLGSRLMIIAIFTLLTFMLLSVADRPKITLPAQKSGGDFFVDVKSMGAKGDGSSRDTAYILSALARCAEITKKTGTPATLFFPEGVYLTGPFNLTSDLTLFVSPKATIVAIPDKDEFPGISNLPSFGETIDPKNSPGNQRHAPFIGAFSTKNVKITGGGKIDGQGKYWWRHIPKYYNLNNKYGFGQISTQQQNLKYTRPCLIEFYESSNIIISDISLVSSAFWTIHVVYSDKVRITGTNITNEKDSPNTDGIDINSSTNIEITHSTISTGDDLISVKSGFNAAGRKFARPSVNITVSDCTFYYGRGLSVGSETSGDVRNVTFSNSVLFGSLRGPRVKTMRGRGGVIEDVTFSNIQLFHVETGISVDMFYKNITENKPMKDTAAPLMRNIVFKDINGVNITRAGDIKCLPECPCRGISMSNIRLKGVFSEIVLKDKIEPFSCQNAHGSQTGVFPASCLSEAPLASTICPIPDRFVLPNFPKLEDIHRALKKKLAKKKKKSKQSRL